MPYMLERPVTEARLASALELKVMIPVVIRIGSGISVEWPVGLTLGTIGRMARTQTREVRRRYMLGTYAFEPYDIIPGRITTNLRLEKVVLYSEYVATSTPSNTIERGLGQTVAGLSNLSRVFGTLGSQDTSTLHLSDGDLLGALGYVSGNLFFQQTPFAIQEIVHPPESVTGKQPTVTTYYDCWLTSNPIEYDIHDRTQIIMQECDVAVGKVSTSIPVEKAVVPLVRKLLPTSVKIGI